MDRNRLEPVHIDFDSDRQKAEQFLTAHGPLALHHPITAFLEAPLGDTVPGTGSREGPDYGTIPQFVVPLPLRPHKPTDLIKQVYPKVRTCHNMPAKFPVDRGLVLDQNGDALVWNIFENDHPPMPKDYANRVTTTLSRECGSLFTMDP